MMNTSYTAKLETAQCIVRRYYSDRLFSQIMRHLLSFFIAKNLNKKHLHYKFPADIENNFEQILSSELVLDEIYDGTYDSIHNKYFSLADQGWAKIYDVDWIFNDMNIATLKKAYQLDKHTPTFAPGQKCNVAIHIRRGDVKSYYGSYTPMEFFENTIAMINSLLDANFHIYSDSPIDVGYENVNYHINENLLESVHDMVNADILIMSIGSNLSHFCGLLNKGIVYFDRSKLAVHFNNTYNIWFSKYETWIFDELDFMKKINRCVCR